MALSFWSQQPGSDILSQLGKSIISLGGYARNISLGGAVLLSAALQAFSILFRWWTCIDQTLMPASLRGGTKQIGRYTARCQLMPTLGLSKRCAKIGVYMDALFLFFSESSFGGIQSKPKRDTGSLGSHFEKNPHPASEVCDCLASKETTRFDIECSIKPVS